MQSGFSRRKADRKRRHGLELYRLSLLTRCPGLSCVLCHGLRLLPLGIYAIVVTVVACQLVQFMAKLLESLPPAAVVQCLDVTYHVHV